MADSEQIEQEGNEEPGYCFGHWEDCKECEMCEIQDPCRQYTDSIKEDANGEKEDEK